MKISILVVAVLSLFIPAMCVAQSLQSGALLTIQKSDGSLHLGVYDSQIHSGFVQASPCDGSLVTDAYVLQGGSPTGCDNGDSFETTQAQGKFKFVGTGYEFDVTTSYQPVAATRAVRFVPILTQDFSQLQTTAA